MITWEPQTDFTWQLLFTTEKSKVTKFCEENNCRALRDYGELLFECTEEDFIMLRLRHPGIVRCVRYVV